MLADPRCVVLGSIPPAANYRTFGTGDEMSCHDRPQYDLTYVSEAKVVSDTGDLRLIADCCSICRLVAAHVYHSAYLSIVPAQIRSQRAFHQAH